MHKIVKWTLAIAIACVGAVAGAQDVSGNVGLDFSKYTKPNTEVQTLGPDLFGDQVSMYTGTAEFRTTDVSIPGNNSLSVAVGRRYVVEDRHDGSGMYPAGQFDYVGSFGDWELDIPHLHGVFTAASGAGNVGWQVSTSGAPNQRCSVDTSNYLSATPPNENGSPSFPFSSAEYWYGNSLYLPGDGDQKMLVISQGNTERPSDGNQYYWATAHKWVFSCLTSTANGVVGEGFLGVSPSGTKYWFNWIVSRPFKPIQKPYGTCANGCATTTLTREEDWILPTKIQDRFGNTVTYTYDPANPWHLLSIVSSDGREIDLSYNSAGTIAKVTANAQTWTYTYNSAGGLTGVALPDNKSAWSLDFSSITPAGMSYSNGGDCGDSPILNGATNVQATLVHPSGAIGKFTFSARRHGRSNVPVSCVFTAGGGSYPAQADVIDVLSIDSKSISGAGVSSPQLWTYSYGAANASYANQCSGGSCSTTKTVTVTNPDGSWDIHTYSNQYNAAEGKELSVQTGSGSTALETEAESYLLDPTGQPYPSQIGQSPCNRCDPDGQVYQPLQSRVISRDGVTYTYTVNAFDAFARPSADTRSNSLGYSKTDATQYSDNLGNWTIGQLAKLTTNGIEVERFDYDPSTALPTNYYKFGELAKALSYNADGTLNQTKDGLGHATTSTNWKNGVPQKITFADNTQETLSVDGFGNVTSVTDQANSTTSYAYDPVGRVTQITYPSSDEQTWYPAAYTYDFVPTAERGVAGNHWRRTILRGNLSQVTLYDVFWRPILSDTSNSSDGGSHISARVDYDWRGNKTFTSYPVAGTPDIGAISGGVSSSFDALDRLHLTQQSSELAQGTLTTTTNYLSGAQTQVTDPNNNVTTTSYQSFDVPSYKNAVLVQLPAGITQTIARDVFGSPTAVTQSGAYGAENDSITKTMIYDANHRLCRTVEPESGSTVLSYDAADNISWSAEGQAISGNDCGQDQVAVGAHIVRTYDQLNRLQSVTPPTGTQATSYNYDLLGNVRTVASGVSVWTASRNKLGQLTGEALQVNGENAWAIGYAHDAYQNVSLIHYPDGENVSYSPDPMGRATQAGAYASGIGYFPNGQVASFTFGNGAAYLATQNARQLLGNFSYGLGGTLNISEDFIYDANRNITNVNDLVDGRRTKAFGYDGLDRVTSATASNLYGAESYTYDALNNLRSRTTGGNTFSFNYDSNNRLVSETQGSGAISQYQYDSQGNRTSVTSGTTSTQYSFDVQNRLLQVPGTESYAYDGFGHRIMKAPANGAAPIYYFYSEDGKLLYQWDTGATKATNFIYLGHMLIAQDDALKLNAPVSISFDTNPNNGSYVVSWSSSTNATSYTLQESYNGGAWTAVYSGNATSVGLSGRAGGNYTYQVQACATGTCSSWTGSGTLGVRPVLPTVTVPSGTINGSYNVSWTAPASATSYDVQESVNGGAWTTIASSIIGTSISRPGTSSGSYTYQVSAKNIYGSRGWAASAAVTVDTTYGVVPSPPSTLTVPGSSSSGSATLSWSAASLATSYVVEQSNNGGATWTGTYNGSATTTTVTSLANGNYIYHVKACDTWGCSGWTQGGTTLVVTHPPSSAPTLSAPANSTNGSYAVTWTSVTGQTTAVLQEKVNSGGWTTIQSGAYTSANITGRGNGSYSYQVQACNVGGCGPWSNIVTTTVLFPPSNPSSISVPSTSAGSIAVSWASTATATSYNLYQSVNGGGWSAVYSGSATSTTVTEGANANYTFGVQACNASGCSGLTTSSAVTVLLPPAVPNTPTVTKSVTQVTSVFVNWNSVSGATYYQIEETHPQQGVLPLINSNGTSYTISPVHASGIMSFRIRACNSVSCSGWSGSGQVLVSAP